MPDAIESPLTKLHPRKTLGAPDIAALLADISAELQAAAALDIFRRMELNHDTRFAWWPGQTDDGRKWNVRERWERLSPGQEPARAVFPWPGASDSRVRLVETVIREHNVLKRLATDRRQQRIGPRNLSPDEDPQAKAALWAQIADYYDDITRRETRRAVARWADIAQEYGSAILFTGWRAEHVTVKKSIDAARLADIIEAAAMDAAREQTKQLWLAEGGDPERVPELDAEQEYLITQDAAAKLADMILDDEQRALLAARLMEVDPEMPRDEAARVAKELKSGEAVEYFAVTLGEQTHELRALTYGVDVLFPALTERMGKARWVVVPEWVDEVEMNNRVNNPHEAYTAAAVKSALEHPGKSVDLSALKVEQTAWILSGGHVRCGVRDTSLEEANQKMFQILHVYYRACAIGNVPALYHTVLHGSVPDQALYHECCEHLHGRMPFFEHLTDLEAPYILASEGYGEKSFTDQNDVKTHRDSRNDSASITIKPPLEVPFNQNKRVNWRPGEQIPVRATAGMGVVKPMSTGSDPRGAADVENATRDSFNEYWCRGPKVDPEMKRAFNQVLVSDFLTDLGAVKECIFQLIQEMAPQNIRASFVGGLPVSLNVSREDIQGRVGIELDYDLNELDPDRAEKTVKSLVLLRQLDPGNEMQYNTLLRALVSYLLPAHYKTLVANPNAKAKEETADEKSMLADILSGTQFDEADSYVPGTNHNLRLQVMQRIFGAQTDKQGNVLVMQPNGADGQTSRAQRLYNEDPDVQLRVQNRFNFHARQIQQQQENAKTGRELVEPVTEE